MAGEQRERERAQLQHVQMENMQLAYLSLTQTLPPSLSLYPSLTNTRSIYLSSSLLVFLHSLPFSVSPPPPSLLCRSTTENMFCQFSIHLPSSHTKRQTDKYKTSTIFVISLFQPDSVCVSSVLRKCANVVKI